MCRIEYRQNPDISNAALNALYQATWPAHEEDEDFGPVLAQCLAHLGAYDGGRLVGFVKLAWDGRRHAFLLDPTVHPEYQHGGIGSELVRRAVTAARDAGCEWLHVDYEEALSPFYESCGFTPTPAGLIRLA